MEIPFRPYARVGSKARECAFGLNSCHRRPPVPESAGRSRMIARCPTGASVAREARRLCASGGVNRGRTIACAPGDAKRFSPRARDFFRSPDSRFARCARRTRGVREIASAIASPTPVCVATNARARRRVSAHRGTRGTRRARPCAWRENDCAGARCGARLRTRSKASRPAGAAGRRTAGATCGAARPRPARVRPRRCARGSPGRSASGAR